MKKVTKAIAAIMLMTAVVFATGCTKEETGSGSYNGHNYVDLGLPSGTLWATSNLEAGNSKGYSFFAWGETQTKSTYTWDTYKFYEIVGNLTRMTEYSSDDHQTVLYAEDDAVVMHWGEAWRMPTHEEWNELVNNCTYTWTKRNGTYGGLFTASNGNTLFLPAAGFMDRPEAGGHIGEGIVGNYWSSSLATDSEYNAKSIQLTDGEIGANNECFDPRCLGYSIRPVHDLLNMINTK